jgi:hypothetical protein
VSRMGTLLPAWIHARLWPLPVKTANSLVVSVA